MGSYLLEILPNSVNLQDHGGVRDKNVLWPSAHNLSMLIVQPLVLEQWVAISHQA